MVGRKDEWVDWKMHESGLNHLVIALDQGLITLSTIHQQQ